MGGGEEDKLMSMFELAPSLAVGRETILFERKKKLRDFFGDKLWLFFFFFSRVTCEDLHESGVLLRWLPSSVVGRVVQSREKLTSPPSFRLAFFARSVGWKIMSNGLNTEGN